jgi:hypothetical protein
LMWDEAFIGAAAILFIALLKWACKALPGEGWQIMASLPVTRNESGTWSGVNLTYYGVFVSGSCTLSVAVFLILMGAIGIRAVVSTFVVVCLLAFCVPASTLLARMVEKKRHTLTIGGASFLGVLLSPVVLWGVDAAAGTTGAAHVPMLPAMACLAIAYALGEGVGRLACISFGCCYGRHISDCHTVVRRLVGKRSFVFAGSTKKIAYESGLEGEPVVPIQAVTSGVYVAAGLASMLLYLKGHFAAAIAVSMIVTQTWRALSETLRADYRGEGTFSAYQIMSLVAVVYALGVLAVAPAQPVLKTDLSAGIAALWDPAILVFLQALALAIFWFSGRSKVTGSLLSFHVLEDRR